MENVVSNIRIAKNDTVYAIQDATAVQLTYFTEQLNAISATLADLVQRVEDIEYNLEHDGNGSSDAN